MTAPLVVLGAGGKLGRLLSRSWPEGTKQYARAELDIFDTARLSGALEGAAAVLCLAGVTNRADQPMSLNTTLAQHVLDAAQKVSCGRVLLLSSAAVYGRGTGLLSEDATALPLSAYGKAKLHMEHMAMAHAHPNVTARLGNVAGADAILGCWRPGFELDVLPNGKTPRRSYIGLRSLARVLQALAHVAVAPRLVNVSAPGAIEMGALLDAAKLPWTPRPATQDTISSVELDTARLSAFIKWPEDAKTAKGMVDEWKEVTAFL